MVNTASRGTDEEQNASDCHEGAPSIQLFASEDVDKKLESIGRHGVDQDESRRLRELLDRMRSGGNLRRLHFLADSWADQLRRLLQIFPNFAALFDYLFAVCALALRGDRTVRMDPVLLLGPAGIGKTLVAEEVATVIAGGFARITMSTAQSNGLLCGSEEFWSNSKSGLVFRTLVDGAAADPLILLDELDKASEDTRFNPLTPLYELLEPNTARKFVDLSVQGVPIDTSRVLWIATANEKHPIPDPILSRFHLVEVNAPTRDQARAVVRSVDDRLRQEMPAISQIDLTEAAVDELLSRPPREVRKALLLAYGRAALESRDSVLPEHIGRPPSHHKRSAGFA